MEYLYYNQPLIYVQENKYSLTDYMTARFQFAKPDNGNYVILINELISMYVEAKPEKVLSFEDAIEFIKEQIKVYEKKLLWNKLEFIPPKYIVDNILRQERLEKLITERMVECEDEVKKKNYEKQLRDIRRCLRRLHKRVHNFQTSGGCDIHELSYIDFSPRELNSQINKLNNTIKKIEKYREETKDEKPFIF